MENNNSIFTLYPYKENGIQWMFDQLDMGITREAFVGNSDTLIDSMVNGKEQCLLLFSDKPFPESNVELKFKEQDDAGTTYDIVSPERPYTSWLCNCLLNFYPHPPQNIYAKIKA